MEYSKHPLAVRAMSKIASPLPSAPLSNPTFRQLAGEAVKSPAFLGLAAGTALSGVASGVVAGASKLKDLYDRTQSYKQMLALTPVLRDHDDQTQVKQYFNSLHRANPHFMNDPLVAGALVHRVIEAQQDLGGGGGRPSPALATMVSELASGRAQLTSAFERESKMQPNIGGPLKEIVAKGFETAGEIAAKGTPQARLLQEIEDRRRDLTKETRSLAEAKYQQKVDKLQAAVQERVARARDLERQNAEAERRQRDYQESFKSRPSAQFSQELARRTGQKPFGV
jgi:hypothetical protein